MTSLTQQLLIEEIVERSSNSSQRSNSAGPLGTTLTQRASSVPSLLSCICVPLRPALSALSSVERPILHQALHPPLSVPSWEEHSVFRWEFRPAKNAPSSTDRSVLRRALCPPSNNPDSKSIKSPVSCVRVLHCHSNSGQRQTIAGKRILARTDGVLCRAFWVLFHASVYRFISEITSRDTPALGGSDQLKPQEKIQKSYKDLVNVKRLDNEKLQH